MDPLGPQAKVDFLSGFRDPPDEARARLRGTTQGTAGPIGVPRNDQGPRKTQDAPACARCSERDCPASRCIICREEADSPGHILLRCPSLAETRLRLLGSIYPLPEDESGPCGTDQGLVRQSGSPGDESGCHEAAGQIMAMQDESGTVGRIRAPLLGGLRTCSMNQGPRDRAGPRGAGTTLKLGGGANVSRDPR